MKKVLITGGTGFIGSKVTDELLKRGYEVHSLVYPPFAAEQKNLIQYEMNLMDSKAVDYFFSEHQFDSLIHLAWYVGPKCQISSLNLDWLETSLHLIKTFVAKGGTKVLAAGSMSEYNFSYGWCREDETPLQSLSLYGQSKAALYQTIKKFSEHADFDFKWVRLFNLYGPAEKPARLMPSVINAMLKGEDVRVSACTQMQNYLYVEDAAKAIVDVFESDVNGAVNICADHPVVLRDIVELIKKQIGFKGNILYGALPASFEQQLVTGDNTKLKALGWKQETTLEEGLRLTIDWWKSHNV